VMLQGVNDVHALELTAQNPMKVIRLKRAGSEAPKYPYLRVGNSASHPTLSSRGTYE
jgi:hypothetical protein